MARLMGAAYYDYWRHRSLRGKRAVGPSGANEQQVIEQGVFLWDLLKHWLPDPGGIERVCEFGCGWGRLTDKLAAHYPDAQVFGVDFQVALVDIAVDRARGDERRFYSVEDHIPDMLAPLDLVFTSSVLHHVTDPDVWGRVVASFHGAVRPGGWLVMQESVIPCMDSHMTGRDEDGFKEALDGFLFREIPKPDPRDVTPRMMVARRRPCPPFEAP